MTTRAFPARRVVSPAMRAARRRENIAAYLFMAPSLVFFLGFVIFPMGMCLVTSFFNYTMTDFSWIGLANYVEMFHDAISARRWSTRLSSCWSACRSPVCFPCGWHR